MQVQVQNVHVVIISLGMVITAFFIGATLLVGIYMSYKLRIKDKELQIKKIENGIKDEEI